MDRIFCIVLACYLIIFTNKKGSCGGSGEETIQDDLPLYDLHMTTEMFNYTLYWDAPTSDQNLRYTVIYKYNSEYLIEPYELFDCKDIIERRCNIETGWKDGIEPGNTIYDIHVYYHVDGTHPRSNKTVYRTREIMFHPHKNVSLVAPEFELQFILAPDNLNVDLFVKPVDPKHWKDGQSIGKHVKELEYQIQYWTLNNTDKKINNFTRKLNQEISKQVPSGPTYCVRLRLYAKFDDDEKMSKWTEPKCIETSERATTNSPDEQDTSQQTHTIIIATSCGIAVIILLILLGCCGRKIRKLCKSIHGKGPLPDTLITILKDNDSQPQNHNERVYNYFTEECVDLLPPGEPYPFVPNYSQLQVPTERQYTIRGTSSCELSTKLSTDEYLRLPPVFDDEPLPNETTKFNMTYGIGYVYNPEIDYCLDTTQTTHGEFMGDSATLHRPILASFLSNTESMLSPNDAVSRRHFTMSLSSYASETGLIFDIQRSNDAVARSNFYLAGMTDSQTVDTSGDIMNIAYSSNPVTKIPDVIIKAYCPESSIEFKKDQHPA